MILLSSGKSYEEQMAIQSKIKKKIKKKKKGSLCTCLYKDVWINYKTGP